MLFTLVNHSDSTCLDSFKNPSMIVKALSYCFMMPSAYILEQSSVIFASFKVIEFVSALPNTDSSFSKSAIAFDIVVENLPNLLRQSHYQLPS